MADELDPKFVNCNLKPMEVVESPFLYEIDFDQVDKYRHEESGKWMQFYPNDRMNDAWEMAKKLYNEKKLRGISSMKTSTAFKNPTASNHSDGVVIFYCGPPKDEAKMMEYGRNLLAFTNYTNKFGQMFYKSDEQTNAGTRATGQKKNHLYKLNCPKF